MARPIGACATRELKPTWSPAPSPSVRIHAPSLAGAGQLLSHQPTSHQMIVTLAYTNNVLISVAFLEQHRLRFDLRFGRSGGEDSHFLPGSSVREPTWCGAEAIVFDAVPDAGPIKWLFRRQVRTGNSRTQITRPAGPPGSNAFIRGEVSGMDLRRTGRMARRLLPGQNPPRAGALQNGLGIRPRSGHLCPTI